MTPSTPSPYVIDAETAGTVVERTPRDHAEPFGWMVRCICGYKAGPYAAGLVRHANEIRDQHEAEPFGWMVRCICGYKAGPYAAGLVRHANEIRDQHEAVCLWPKAAAS